MFNASAVYTPWYILQTYCMADSLHLEVTSVSSIVITKKIEKTSLISHNGDSFQFLVKLNFQSILLLDYNPNPMTLLLQSNLPNAKIAQKA